MQQDDNWKTARHMQRVRAHFGIGVAATQLRKDFADVDLASVETFGLRFIDVTMFFGPETCVVQQHVDDYSTIPETIRIAMEKSGATHAVYPYMGRWCLVTPGKSPTKLLRYYDTEEAAKMVARFNA